MSSLSSWSAGFKEFSVSTVKVWSFSAAETSMSFHSVPKDRNLRRDGCNGVKVGVVELQGTKAVCEVLKSTDSPTKGGSRSELFPVRGDRGVPLHVPLTQCFALVAILLKSLPHSGQGKW